MSPSLTHYRNNVSNKTFRRWMSRIGINLFFFVIYFLLWILYTNVFVTTIYPNLFHLPSLRGVIASDEPIRNFLKLFSRELGFDQFCSDNFEKYGSTATWWLFVLRFHPWLFLQVTIPYTISLLCSTPPELDEDESSGSKNGNRQPVHCICIRILTRGDEGARPLLRNAVTTAVRLFSDLCSCEKLKVHVVTNTPFLDKPTVQKWTTLGATEVKEMAVLSDYRTPNGTLFKARNICYWQEKGGGVGADCDEERSWIMSLDEEAIITRALIQSFINDILKKEDDDRNPKFGYGLPLATIDVNSAPISFMCRMMEARWVALYYAYLQPEMSGTRGGLCLHGGAYLVRASVDRRMGNDWGPKVSVAEDFATGVCANEQQIPVKYLSGWFLEGASPTLSGYILQRARILRGQIYAVSYLPMKSDQKSQQIFRLSTHAFIYPFGHSLLLLIFIWSPFTFMPAGPRCVVLDSVFWFTMCIQICTGFFGSTNMAMSKNEILGSILFSPFFTFFIASVIDAAVALTAFWFMIKDWRSGSVGYAVTQKIGITKKEKGFENKRA